MSVCRPRLPWTLQGSEPLFLITEDLALSLYTHQPMGWEREGIWQDVVADPRAARAVRPSPFPLSFVPPPLSSLLVFFLCPRSPKPFKPPLSIIYGHSSRGHPVLWGVVLPGL